MIVNKALIAATVLLFTAPVVPALARDGYGDRGYVRCLDCPGNWHDHYGWPHYYDWPHYHRGWRYGDWPYGGWRYSGWEYEH
jgi:hypothetical protein